MNKIPNGKDPRNINLPNFAPLEVDMDEHHSNKSYELDQIWDGETIEKDIPLQ